MNSVVADSIARVKRNPPVAFAAPPAAHASFEPQRYGLAFAKAVEGCMNGPASSLLCCAPCVWLAIIKHS